MAMRLNDILPEGYRSGVKVHLGSPIEVDLATYERDSVPDSPQVWPDSANTWQADSPTLLLETEELAPAE
jgi:hypothetical protein